MGWTNLNSEQYLKYMVENEHERRQLKDSNIKPPPWSSIYAYTHQHTKLNLKNHDDDDDDMPLLLISCGKISKHKNI